MAYTGGQWFCDDVIVTMRTVKICVTSFMDDLLLEQQDAVIVTKILSEIISITDKTFTRGYVRTHTHFYTISVTTEI